MDNNENQKNLPIKIFQKRQEVDERLVEGGGNNTPLKWVLSGQELKARSEALMDELNFTEQSINIKLGKYQNIPAVLKAKITNNALAKSHRGDFVKFLTASRNDRILGFTDEQEILIRIDDAEQIDVIGRKLLDTENNAKVISGMEAIKPLDPSIDVQDMKKDNNDKFILKIRLIDYNNNQINDIAYRAFRELIDTLEGIKLDKTVRYSDELMIHQVTVDSLDAIGNISDFNALFSVQPMPTIDLFDDDFFVDETIQFPEPDADIDYPLVGILDTGIAVIPQLQPWIVGNRHTNYPNHFIDPSHGTFVSGIVCYGDLLEGISYTGVNGCRLFDAAVYPDKRMETITEGDLVDNIREVIERNRDEIKIWNMSLGSGTEVKYEEFSEMGIALDNIQDENEVLIVKSAGNSSNFLLGRPNSRIANGADSVRSLTVGSIAQSQLPSDLALVNHLSPFSRIGPGPANIIKPEVVHYGGNSGVNQNAEPIPNGVKSFAANGMLTKKIGTSFSTPRVTALVAGLHNKLREEFDPILLKALVIHSAKYPQEINLPVNDKLEQLGFGLPSSLNEIIYNDPHEITMIIRDNLVKGEFVDILDFPFPESMVDEEGNYYGQISLTLVSSPIVTGGQGSEYCQSNVDVMLGTYDQRTFRDTTKRIIRNPIGREGTQNLLLSSIYSKKIPLESDSFARTERMLVQYGDKFYPNKKYAMNLSDLTPGNKEKSIRAPKKWFLKVSGLYRDFIESKAVEERMDLSQEYCVVVTIKDPTKQVMVYDEVTRLLNQHNFVHRDIRIKQTVEIHLDQEDDAE